MNYSYKTVPCRMLALALLTSGLAISTLAQAPVALPSSAAPPEAPTLADPDEPATAPAVPTAPIPRAGKRSGGQAPGSFGGGADTFGGGAGGFFGGGGIGGTAPSFAGAPSAANPTGIYSVAVSRSGSKDSVPPVVVEFSSTDPAALEHMEEDLAVMTHIISQALEGGLGEDTPPSAMGVQLLYTAGGRSVRSMYLGGFGALFMIKVNMPLMAQPASSEAKPSEKAADSEWEAARREVLGLNSKEESFGRTVVGSESPFNPEQVEALKRTLIGALKNAANIRGLKDDEYVSVAVFGQPMAQSTVAAPSTSAHGTPLPATVAKSANEDPIIEGAAPPKASSSSSRAAKASRKTSPSRNTVTSTYGSVVTPDGFVGTGIAQKGTVLTFRAKKSDIDAFAQGKSKFEDFAKVVTITAYPGNGYGVASVNSWVGSGRLMERR